MPDFVGKNHIRLQLVNLLQIGLNLGSNLGNTAQICTQIFIDRLLQPRLHNSDRLDPISNRSVIRPLVQADDSDRSACNLRLSHLMLDGAHLFGCRFSTVPSRAGGGLCSSLL
ncbi:hypothetical protein D3C73_1028300 [compost metagenome]